MDYYKAALELHEQHKGKIEVTAKVPVKTRDDLSAAYTPGVAEPCRKIAADEEEAYTLYSQGKPGGCGDRRHGGAGAGRYRARRRRMPVMEGKAIAV